MGMEGPTGSCAGLWAAAWHAHLLPVTLVHDAAALDLRRGAAFLHHGQCDLRLVVLVDAPWWSTRLPTPCSSPAAPPSWACWPC